MTSKPCFVVDTNTLVSAILVEGSTPDRALRRAREIGVLLVSPDTIDEAVEVLSREKFDPYVPWALRQEFLEAFADQSVVVEPTVSITACRDPDDNKFLEVAVEGDATAIISGDADLLALDPFRGVAIVEPAAFLAASWL